MTFLVRHVDACGLEAATDPTFKRDGDTLAPKLHDSNSAVLLFDCKYEVGYTFEDSTLEVK